MGAVYLALDLRLNKRYVAVKEPEFIKPKIVGRNLLYFDSYG